MGVARVLLSLVWLFLSGCVVHDVDARSDTAVSDRGERGLWVTRWDFRSADDVERAVRDASSIGVTDVYFQVRGQADAYYASALEPWGEELTKHTGPEPGFDPLAVAVREAHARGMRLHAWVNVMPAWRGTALPGDASHMLNARPAWRLSGVGGEPQALHEGYVVVNPVRLDVHDHIVRVVRDIVTRYDVDGVHLDYVRFLSDEVGDALMPGDAASLAQYARETGASSDAGRINTTAYRAWVRSKITTLVRRIANESLAARGGVRLSAAVWRRPDLAHDRYLQDAAGWARRGYVGALMPMIYTTDTARYRDDLAAWVSEADESVLVPGIGVYMHDDPGTTLDQIAAWRVRRFAVFAYASVFESPNPGQVDDAASKETRRERREALAALSARLGR